MRVKWAAGARRELAEIHRNIASNSARYANITVARIAARCGQLSKFPLSGAVVADYGDPEIRELVEGSYRIIYRVCTNSVQILAVIHGARLLPPL